MNSGINVGRRVTWAPWVAASVVFGFGAGALLTVVNPVFVLPLIPVGVLAVWAIRTPARAMWILIAGIAVLPRIASPVSIGFRPTVTDAGLALFFVAWFVDRARRRRVSPEGRVPPGVAIPLLGLAFVSIAAFIFGIPNGPLTTLVARRFAELILTLLAVYALAGVFAEEWSRALAVRAFAVFGALAAVVGLVLYVIPDETTIRLLSALRPFGYPEGSGVVRFVRDDPALLQRATGLWIDPNAFGGFLLVVGAITLPQVFTSRPVMPRLVAVGCMGLIGLALMTTISRGAMLGLAIVALMLGVLRYRRILPLMAGVLALALVLPQTRELVAHFADGLAFRDLASQMRLGEYKDAFRLIERYPVFGVGFADTPDVDLYIGVSNLYLLVAQQMGLAGLAVFVMVISGMLTLAVQAAGQGLRARSSVGEGDVAVWLGAHGAVFGALLTGVFDHYFFNIDFHNSVALFWLAFALAVASSTTILHHVAAQGESSQEGRHRLGVGPGGQRDRARIRQRA